MPPAGALAPVVLVGGASGGQYFEETAAQMALCGWRDERIYRYYRQALGCIGQEAENLREFMDDVLAETGASSADVLGYSLGGLLVRHWMTFMGGADRVDEFVLWGSPNRGSPYTQPDDPLCWMREMMATSDYIACLNGEGGAGCANPYGVPAPFAAPFSAPAFQGVAYYNLFSPQDLFLPEASTILEGAMNISVPLTIHTDFHRKPEVHRLTMAGFLRRDPVDPVTVVCGTLGDSRGGLAAALALLFPLALRPIARGRSV